MSGKNDGTAAQGNGQPGAAPVTPQPAGPVGEGTQGQPNAQAADPKFLTLEEATAMEQRILNTARSYSDKQRLKVEKAAKTVTESIATLRAQGLEITPDQETQMTQKAVNQAMVEPEPNPTNQQPVQAAGQPTQDDPITLEAKKLQTDAGIQILDSDPEVKSIVIDKGPFAYLKSVEAAVTAKKSRLASQGTNQSDPASRIPTSGEPAGNRLPDGMTGHQAFERVKHKV